jgi:hypothetical protein
MRPAAKTASTAREKNPREQTPVLYGGDVQPRRSGSVLSPEMKVRSHAMSTIETTYPAPALAAKPAEHDARGLLGQVMGFVSFTVGFAALGHTLRPG